MFLLGITRDVGVFPTSVGAPGAAGRSRITGTPLAMTPKQIDALKRLQRAGDPNSKTTEKIRVAVQAMVEHVLSIVPPTEAPVVLPGAYEIRTGYDEFDDAEYRYICLLDGSAPEALPVGHDSELDLLYHFAADVHGGLIERIEERYNAR